MPTFAKRVRDPMYGDVRLTADELRIIDTRQFQNLRGIKQLGLAYLVYPAATHTRFEHALGTLHMAQRIIDGINNGRAPEEEKEVSDEIETIIRIAALVHDIPHTPFGHSIEDDLGLRVRHDKPKRVAPALGPNTDVGRVLEDLDIRDHVEAILCAGEEGAEDLGNVALDPPLFPYMADIISNTVCADLLDYVRRDTYFSGVRAAFDDRIFEHFEIDSKTRRLAIRVEHKGRYRTAVLSEVMNILRARYALAERLIFHHAHQAAVAMFGRAWLDWPGRENDPNPDLSDFEFLTAVQNEGGEVAKDLVSRLRRRDLHKQVYVGSRKVVDAQERLEEIVTRFRKDNDSRVGFENELADGLGSPHGSVIVHCPDGDMALKEANVRVITRGKTAEVLREIGPDPPPSEVAELENKYKSLWSLQVFIASEWQFHEYPLSELLETQLDFPNDLRQRQKSFWELLRSACMAYDQVGDINKLSPDQLTELKQTTYGRLRSYLQETDRREKELSIDSIVDHIRELGRHDE